MMKVTQLDFSGLMSFSNWINPGYRTVGDVSPVSFMFGAYHYEVGTFGDDNYAKGTALILAELLGDRLNFFDGGSLGVAPAEADLSSSVRSHATSSIHLDSRISAAMTQQLIPVLTLAIR